MFWKKIATRIFATLAAWQDRMQPCQTRHLVPRGEVSLPRKLLIALEFLIGHQYPQAQGEIQRRMQGRDGSAARAHLLLVAFALHQEAPEFFKIV